MKSLEIHMGIENSCLIPSGTSKTCLNWMMCDPSKYKTDCIWIIFKHFRFSNSRKGNILDFHSKWFIFSIRHTNEWNQVFWLEWKLTKTRVPFIRYHLKVTQNRFWMNLSLQNESWFIQIRIWAKTIRWIE